MKKRPKSSSKSKKKSKSHHDRTPPLKSGLAEGYLHGFTNQEQDRLYRQAQFFEPYIYPHIHFPSDSRVIEVGCGVGAQTQILLRRYPGIRVTGIDASEMQLKRAAHTLKDVIRAKKVELKQADALHLPADDNAYDG